MIYLDIEGFSEIYKKNEGKAYDILSELVSDIYHIMTRIFHDTTRSISEARLSLITYHLGDAFFISPGPLGWDLNLEIPLSISITLMKALSRIGAFAKTAISYGNMVDYSSIFPSDIQNNIEHSYIKTHTGLFTIFPVMGLGWINAVKLSEKDSGPLLLLDQNFQESLDKSKFRLIEGYDLNYICIDWINTKNELITEIFNKINITQPSPDDIRKSLSGYLEINDMGKRWKTNAEKLIGINHPY